MIRHLNEYARGDISVLHGRLLEVIIEALDYPEIEIEQYHFDITSTSIFMLCIVSDCGGIQFLPLCHIS